MSRNEEPILTRTEGAVLYITLNRPKARNAFDRAMTFALGRALAELENSENVLVGVLESNVAGVLPVFSSGADLRTDESSRPDAGAFASMLSNHRLKPLIAAVDGLASGLGFELILSCDFAIASDRSSFTLPAGRRNLVASAGGAFLLAQRVGSAVALDAMMTGQPISADRAFQLGLVSRLVRPPELIDAARAAATQICDFGPLAIRRTRQLVAAASEERASTLWSMSALADAELLSSIDFHEGSHSMFAGRTPNWTGT